jgi:MFS family permease
VATVLARLALPAGDLLRNAAYRRLFTSVLISSFGGQITLLALPLTAALLLDASPSQMGWLTAMEIVPFVLFSLPAGVWLDRVHKLPVYIGGELVLALAVATVPLAWWLGWLAMPWLYAVGFVIGTVSTTAGSAAQIVLTQVVPRERLVEAHSKNTLASSSAEVTGPGLAGVLVKLMGAPVTLLVDAVMLLASAAILRGLPVAERRDVRSDADFWADLKQGLRFVRSQRLLLTLALTVGCWQFCYNAVVVVQILHATRSLHMSEQAVGLCFVGVGLGSVVTSLIGSRVSSHFGSGPTLVIGIAVCAAGWLLAGLLAEGPWGIAAFALMLVCFGIGGVLSFINFLSLRQAVTPEPLLGRMTSTMRWLILIPAGPGALFGGWLGEVAGLRSTLLFSGVAGLLLAAVAWRSEVLRDAKRLPQAAAVDGSPAEKAAGSAEGG